MKAKNIIWDTDGEVIDGLPTEMEVPDNEDDIADYLSDQTGFCVLSFCL